MSKKQIVFSRLPSVVARKYKRIRSARVPLAGNVRKANECGTRQATAICALRLERMIFRNAVHEWRPLGTASHESMAMGDVKAQLSAAESEHYQQAGIENQLYEKQSDKLHSHLIAQDLKKSMLTETN